MTYRTYKTYINKFNFGNPDWNNLPSDFPNYEPKGLTIMEADILGAINLAWMTTGPGRTIFEKRILKVTAVSFAIIFVMALGGIVILQTGKTLSQSVNAATISATMKLGGSILESTTSALRAGGPSGPEAIFNSH